MISSRRFCTEVFDALPRCKEESREGGRCRSGRDGRKGGVVYILSGGWCTISNAFFCSLFSLQCPKIRSDVALSGRCCASAKWRGSRYYLNPGNLVILVLELLALVVASGSFPEWCLHIQC